MTFNLLEAILQSIAAELPALTSRKSASASLKKHADVSLSERTLANMDSVGTGPRGTHIRGRVMYERDTFIAWLRVYLSNGSQRFKHKEESYEKILD